MELLKKLTIVGILFFMSNNSNAACPSSLDFDIKLLGEDKVVNLCEEYHGKVILVVNTASKCGFTPQYEGLEKLYENNMDKGLVILGFPSHDFYQEPATETEIKDFCNLTYNVKFPMFTKTKVRGKDAHPFFKLLTQETNSSPKWNFHKYLIDRNGNIIASTEESELFVAPYSEPIEGWFTKSEIEQRLMTREDVPDFFLLQHRNTYDYQLNDWGITLPFNRWSALEDGEYYINIDVKWGDGSMKVGEYFLPGKKKETICICAHIDELCNDDLSGCVTAMETMRMLEKSKNRKYSYQMLLSPELIGTIFYLGNNPDKINNDHIDFSVYIRNKNIMDDERISFNIKIKIWN